MHGKQKSDGEVFKPGDDGNEAHTHTCATAAVMYCYAYTPYWFGKHEKCM